VAITVAAVATETSIPGAATLTAEAAVSSVAAIITKAVATSVATLAAETSITRVAALIAEALTAGVAALTTKATVIATLAAEAPVTSIAAETSVITIAAITPGAAITTVTTVGMAASIARATTIHEACWFRARWPASRTIGFTCALGWCAGVATPVLAISLGRRRAGEGSFTHAFPVEVGDAYRPCRTGRGRWAGCGIAGGALDAKSTAWPRRIIHGGLR